MALRLAARRFGLKVSSPKTLIRQDISPFGLCLTLGLQWRRVIEVFFGARHVARPSNWQICWQAGNSGQLGFTPAVRCPNQAISVCIHSDKEGPLRILEAVPLYRSHYGKWRHKPPRDLECTPCRHPCRAENSGSRFAPSL
jgi:hypothetical protein